MDGAVVYDNLLFMLALISIQSGWCQCPEFINSYSPDLIHNYGGHN